LRKEESDFNTNYGDTGTGTGTGIETKTMRSNL
jgi:hypothetical protein